MNSIEKYAELCRGRGLGLVHNHARWGPFITNYFTKEVIFLKYLKQLMIILIAYFLGMLVQMFFNLPIPGTVLGLIFLFLALSFGIVKTEMIEDICEVLISHMSFLFVPAGVGLMTSFDMLKGKVMAFSIIIVISTIVVWIVTVYVVKFLRKVC